MSVENEEVRLDPEPCLPVELVETDARTDRRKRITWWFAFLVQPLLLLTAIIALIFGFGVAQRFGLFVSDEQATEEQESGEEIQYVCPMVCVPPTTEPGKCPVCGMELKAQKASGDSKDKYGLRLDQASIRVANIRTVKAESKPLVQELNAIGEIRYDEGSLATISAYVDGRIEKLFADYTGVKVNDGDELALLYSPDLYSSQVALLESLKLLKESQLTSQRIKDSNQRLYESSRQRLIEFGLTEIQVDQLEKEGKADSRIRIVSPISGTVIEKLSDQGEYVETGQAIYKIADLSSVWLMLELFPKDAARICFGQKVTTKIPSHPGQKFIGRVAFIDPSVDPKTQTVRVRVVIPNESGLIRVGDFATASIVVSASTPNDRKSAVYDADLVGKWISPRHPHVISNEPGKCTECGMDLVPASEFGFVSAPITHENSVVVPRDSVLMAGNQSVVYVETEPGRFEFRQVEVGQIVGDQVSIISGIKQGEMVAMSSAFLIDSAFSMLAKPSLIDPNRAIPRKTEIKKPEIIDQYNTPELVSALAKLSETDRQLVKKQKKCPVANQILGSMGTPIKVDVDGQPVFICCNSCRKRLLGEPEKYLEILANGQNQIDPATNKLPQIQPLDSNELPQIQPLDDSARPQTQPLDEKLPQMKLPAEVQE